jgi:hypothetical protein
MSTDPSILMDALRYTVRALLLATRIDPDEKITTEMVDAHVAALLGEEE